MYLLILTVSVVCTDPKCLLCLHDQYRQEHKVAPLRQDEHLMRVAQRHAERMATTQMLSHQRIGLAVIGLERVLGENIAAGPKTNEEAMEVWKKSRLHRNNMLNPGWNIMGWGKATSKTGTTYWCVVFGYLPPRKQK